MRDENLKRIGLGLARVHDDGFAQRLCGLDVPHEALLLPGQIALAPVVVKPRFAHGDDVVGRTDSNDLFDRGLAAFFILGVQRPGTMEKPRRKPDNLVKLFNFIPIAGNRDGADEPRPPHAADAPRAGG